MEWLKRNGSLALGIGLPVALVIFFMLATWLPRLWVVPPRYDVLYLTNYNTYGSLLDYRVQDKHLVFRYIGQRYPYGRPKLYRYSPGSGSIREIPLPLPAAVSAPSQSRSTRDMKIAPVSVPELENVSVDTSSVAPDGYEFRFGNSASPGLMGDLFFSSGYRNEALLVKDGNIIRIPNAENGNYFYSNVKFVGWVVP